MGKQQYFFEVQVVRIDDLAIMAQSSNGLPLARVLARWLANVLDAEPGAGALCLTCDAEFRGEASWSAMVSAPFAGNGQAIVCGICPDCAGHPDLQGIVVERLRHGAFGGDLEVMPTARS
jgi:hypothetical protein